MTRPGHDGIPPQGPEFAEFLRRELHAAADQLEPRSDGLERIRARVRSGPAYASKHSAAHGGFLADLVRRWNAARGGQQEGGGQQDRGGHERQERDWRYGLLRPALAAACVVFAIGVALAVPPLRAAFVQLSGAVGIPISSTSGGGQSTNGDGTPAGSATGSAGGGTSAAQGSVPPIACASGSASSAQAKSTKAAKPATSVTPSDTPASSVSTPSDSATDNGTSGGPGGGSTSPGDSTTPTTPATGTASATTMSTATSRASAKASGKDGQASAKATPAPSCTASAAKPSKTANQPKAPASASTPGSGSSTPAIAGVEFASYGRWQHQPDRLAIGRPGHRIDQHRHGRQRAGRR